MAWVMGRDGLGALIAELRAREFRVLAQVARDGGLVLDEVRSAADLPRGLATEHAPGHFRMRDGASSARFAFTPGHDSLKRLLHPPREVLVQLRRRDRSFEEVTPDAPPERVAVLGARACDLAAANILGEVMEAPDPRYARRRRALFVVAVTCAEPGGTCFCASMGTGPRPIDGFDLNLTELPDGRFVVERGTAEGESLARALDLAKAGPDDERAASHVAEGARDRMGRALDASTVHDLLLAAREHPRWTDVARRCLTCTSCTMVCPTCFCTRVEDTTDLAGTTAERARRWDSCFTPEFSAMHGGVVRASAEARYRHFITHKLATWHDQLGSSGCVGCGRCITWCPAGIDITAEVAAIRDASRRP